MATKLENYRELLLIRQNGKRRDAIIIGIIFWITFTGLVFLGLTGQLTERSVYIVAAMLAVFGAAYLKAWVQLDRVRAMIELLSNISEEDA